MRIQDIDKARKVLVRHSTRGGLNKYELARLLETSPRTAYLRANIVANTTLGEPLINTGYPDYRFKFTQDTREASVNDDREFRYNLTRNRNANRRAGNSASIGLPSRLVTTAIPKPDLLALEAAPSEAA